MMTRRTWAGLLAGGLLHAQTRTAIRSNRPRDVETLFAGVVPYLTPVDQFFIRSHVYDPAVNERTWKLAVTGQVTQPLSLTMDDLRRMPVVEVVGVLECAGNGRAFFSPGMPGIQWREGAVGNARWRGVRLGDVLRKAGYRQDAVEVIFDGADVPLGKMADFQRGVPLAKALASETLLAYEMNGRPLTHVHGFPLRAVVPGWAGDSWTKWLTGIRVTNRAFDGYWMARAYRYPDAAVAPGSPLPAASHPVASLKVKSMITEAGAGRIAGTAWSGEGGPVTNVDVSVDEGLTWRAARFTSPETPFGWRTWELKAAPGRVTLARARDRSGALQPERGEWNPSGYLWNGYARKEAAEPPRTSMSPPVAAEYRQACAGCHDDLIVRQQSLTPAQWERELDKMAEWGAPVTPGNRSALLEYLRALTSR